MKKNIGLIIFLFLILLPIIGLAEEPVLRAPHSILVEAQTGTVLWAHNEKERVYPASTTKILTVLMALEKAQADADAAGISLEAQLQTELTASQEACDVPWDSSKMGLYIGEKISIYDCMMGTMLISGNESANVLGEYVSGNLDAFADAMNTRARELGAKDTHFVNANGYFDEYHYTTAADMAKIMCAAIKNEVFRTIIGTKTYDLPATEMNEARTIENSNKLLKGGSYSFSQAIGGKTGYTDIAKNCLVAAAEKEGVTVVSAVFEASIIDGEYSSYTDTQALFRYALDNYIRIPIVEEREMIAEQPIRRAKGYKNAKLVSEETVYIVVPKDTVPADVLKRNVILDNEKLKAPLEENAPLGELQIFYTGELYDNNKPMATVRLLADHAYSFSVWSVVRDILLWILGILIAFVVIYIVGMQWNSQKASSKKRQRKYRRQMKK